MKPKLFALILLACCTLCSCVTKDRDYFQKHYAVEYLEFPAPKTPFLWSDLAAMGYKPDFTFETKEIRFGSSLTPANLIAVFHKKPCSIISKRDTDATAWYFDPNTQQLLHIYGYTYHGVIGTEVDENGVERPVRCHEVKREPSSSQ